MRMIERLTSPEYASGQMDAPEQDVIDPFAQFQAPNEGLLSQPKRKTSKTAQVKAFVGPLLQKIAETSPGFVPKSPSRMTLSPDLSSAKFPNYVESSTRLENEKKTANSKLDKGLAAVMKPFELISMLGLLGGARGSRSSRQTPIGQPPMSAPTKLPPRPPSPAWVQDGAQALGNLANNKAMADMQPKAPNPLLQQLLAAGKNAATRKLTGKNPPIRKGDLGKALSRKSDTRRPWVAPFDGPIQ